MFNFRLLRINLQRNQSILGVNCLLPQITIYNDKQERKWTQCYPHEYATWPKIAAFCPSE